MQKEGSAISPALGKPIGVKIKSIKTAGIEDVYCLGAIKHGTMIANGIITKNCDALRYALYTKFGQNKRLKRGPSAPPADPWPNIGHGWQQFGAGMQGPPMRGR
ncbi:hypothetical protein UFOVP255_22 [uncultured Caudovirales phage]|uniref:Uncharacterized protein n=1 Tax=uncultured Caudovirales phage TaxID=2100421 RepID=A0A6J5LE86_9CAUD|nr:hypothetical protein UFOVP255_22 [uncultured Caudovirales phage]